MGEGKEMTNLLLMLSRHSLDLPRGYPDPDP